MPRCEKCLDLDRSRVLAGGHSGGYCPACSQARSLKKHPVLRRKCIGCGKEFLPTHGKQRRCGKDCGRKSHWYSTPKPCKHCGEVFQPTGGPKQQFCSPECGRTFIAAARSQPTACRFCGDLVPRIDGHPRELHDACRAFLAQVRALPKGIPSHLRRCAWCGRDFSTSNRRAVFCSIECRRSGTLQRIHLRWRGVLRGERIPLSRIYQRDRGVCQLCGKRISRRFAPPDPRSATLDHIVPLSLGGRHASENVQLAHFGCNARKGNRPAGEQLRILG